jgi:thymidylate synthase (FAD)
MKVKLVSYSKATEVFEEEGLTDLQELIAFCAKVSNPAAQINTETSERLIKYLIKHQHWSPLEMANVVMEIETTRDIAHQIVRHRSFAFQEFSQRYANPSEMGDVFVPRKARLQDTKNRQNSVITDDVNLHTVWEQHQRNVWHSAITAYEWAIDNGIAKEQARAVLPEGNTKTKLYMNGSIRSWVHYIELRSANGTQKEHMDIAHACADVIASIFPIVNKLT